MIISSSFLSIGSVVFLPCSEASATINDLI
jgi:hypothetical protein